MAKYKVGEKVEFDCNNKIKVGIICNVMPYGSAFSDTNETSYDIFVVDEHCKYTEVKESYISDVDIHLITNNIIVL